MGHSIGRDTVKEPPDVVLARLGVIGAGHPRSDRRDFASFEPTRVETSAAQDEAALPRVDVSRVDPRRAATVVRAGRTRGLHVDSDRPTPTQGDEPPTTERRGVAVLAVLAACALVLGGLVLAQRSDAAATTTRPVRAGEAP